jgi:alanine racemase
MCGSLLQERAALVQHGLVPVVWTVEQVAALRGLQQHPVQVEIDTGMSRQGARPGLELAAVLEDVRAAGLRLQGVFTHLACAEVAGSEQTERQRERFEEAMAQVVAAKMQPEVIHIANTSAVDGAWPQAEWLKVLAERAGAGMLVRTGLGLYGYALPLARDEGGSVEEAKAHLRPELLPVLAWKARVLAVRELAAGDTVGYGATFVAPRAMRVALLPVGYADGLRRELSNPSPGASGAGGWVMARVAEKLVRCAIVGRVSMNLTVCDVSGAPGMATGDEVMVLGEGITAEDHARVAGTIPYEILCGLLSVPRVLTDG